ncbi:MAG TPA: hypothetical protein PLF52_06355 [Syntrophales bacterium]|nr:hypothetical protein [Syntrophales bacterium]
MKTTSSEIDLFNHEEFGEAYLGMAFHVRDMSQLDRIIFEDCTVADGAVVAPHLNVKSRCPVHLRPEIIQKRIGCTFHQAVALADAWSIIEATAKMVNEFIVGIKAKGIEESIVYFEHLAMELAEVEVSWEHEVGESLSDDGGDDRGGIGDGAGNDFDLSGDGDEAYQEEITDLYAYHAVGYDELAEAMELTWEERQSRSYRSLLGKVRGMNDLDSLRALGKKVYALGLSRDQAGVLWYEYRKTERRIMAEIGKSLSVSARRLLQQVRNANGNLAALGARLFKIQRGTVKMADPPRKHEWIVIWAAYHDRQAALRP